MSATRVLAVAAVLLGLGALVPGGSLALADVGPAVTVTTAPTTLTLCPGAGEARVLVTVRNGGPEAIRKLCLRSFSNGPVKLPVTTAAAVAPRTPNSANSPPPIDTTAGCPDGAAAEALPAGGVFSQVVTVALTDYPPAAASVYFWARYQIGSSDTVGETTPAALELKALSPPSADALKLEAKAGFVSLHEGEAGRVVLTISNGTNEKLVLEPPAPSRPTDTRVAIASAAPSAVAPQSTVAVDFQITADKELHPGKYIGLIDVEATTACGIAVHRVASYEVTLGVFGESTLLTLVGVPSLLFLPGFLILTVWMLLWRSTWLRVSFLAKSGSEDFFVAAKDPEFWLLGVTFSLILFAVAPTVTQLGYRRAYSLTDIAVLWAMSVAIGAGVYLVLRAIDAIARWVVRARAAARTITEDDDVGTALERVTRRGWPRDQIRPVRSKTDVQLRGFRLWSDDAGQHVWVIPQIVYRSADPIAPEIDPAAAGLDVAELARRLAALSNGGIRVEWGGLGKPRAWKREDCDDEPAGDLVKFSPQ
ncbi:MAG TPA: hypothetical protein VGD37_07605 [Kofleriaceae bacterium]|jgi:hypothetical protein